MYLDISQVESANWSLSPWLLDYEVDGVIRLRDGNRHAHAAPHGAFPCADEGDIGDRWVAIACWSDASGRALAAIIGVDDARRSRRSPRARQREDEIEALVAAWTATRTRADDRRGAAGAPASRRCRSRTSATSTTIRSSRSASTSSRTRTRSSGPACTSATDSACRTAPSGYDQAGPTLGQDNDWVLRDLLGCTDAEIEAMQASGAVE